MQLAFSTLGAPDWDLTEIVDHAAEHGYDGVDFRGYLEDVDVTTRPEFTDDVAETAAQFRTAGVEASAISTSMGICTDDPDSLLDQAERTVAVANDLGAEYVRVFGLGNHDRYDRDELADFAASTMDAFLDIEGARDVTWMIETHDYWIAAAEVERLLEAIDEPNVGALWDVGNTKRVRDEDPRESIDVLGSDIVYVHVKDATYDPDHPTALDDGYRHVAPGGGEMPLEAAIEGLRAIGYDGWITFEYETRWKPELEPPEVVFPKAAAWFREHVADSA